LKFVIMISIVFFHRMDEWHLEFQTNNFLLYSSKFYYYFLTHSIETKWHKRDTIIRKRRLSGYFLNKYNKWRWVVGSTLNWFSISSSIFRNKYKKNSHQAENWLLRILLCIYSVPTDQCINFTTNILSALGNAAIHIFHFIELLREEHEYQHHKSEELWVQLRKRKKMNGTIEDNLKRWIDHWHATYDQIRSRFEGKTYQMIFVPLLLLNKTPDCWKSSVNQISH
jgi:hypothetical protein